MARDLSGPETDSAVTRSEEEVRVDTMRQEAGRVRLRKYVTTETVSLTVRTRREGLVVERRPATATDQVDEQPPTSSLDHVFTLSAEEVTVQTRTVPKERVRVWVERVVEQRVLSAGLRPRISR